MQNYTTLCKSPVTTTSLETPSTYHLFHHLGHHLLFLLLDLPCHHHRRLWEVLSHQEDEAETSVAAAA